VSRRGWIVGAIGLTAVTAVVVVLVSGAVHDAAATDLLNIMRIAVGGATVSFVFATAFWFPPGASLRFRWMLFATGLSLAIVGDIVWTLNETVMGLPPDVMARAGYWDLFYMAAYPLVGLGLVQTAWAYRDRVGLVVPSVIVGAFSLIAAVVVYITVLSPIVADAARPLLDKVVYSFYPLADVLFELGPALLVLIVIVRLGDARAARPWWWVALGVAAIALSDTAFSYLAGPGTHTSLPLDDVLLLYAFVAIAVGAALARDVYAGSVDESGEAGGRRV
jgi:hypothetical protein